MTNRRQPAKPEDSDGKRHLYGYPAEVALEVTKLLGDTSDEKMPELTAITRHNSIYLACMMGLSDLRKQMVATLEVERLKQEKQKASEELTKLAQPFFLSDRILRYYYRLQRSVGGFTLQKMFDVATIQAETEGEFDPLEDADSRMFGDRRD